MGKKKKGQTSSGKFRCQAAYYDDMGKRRVKSFTAETFEEAQYQAMLWKKEHNNEDRMLRITAAGAVEKYIDSKRAVLSPSTVCGYESIYRTHIRDNPIGGIMVDALNNTQLQIWVSTVASSVSPKTAANVYMLLMSAIDMFLPDNKLRATLPARIRTEYHCPSDQDVQILLDTIRRLYGDGSDLEIAVMLSAFGTLRRGEICALTSDDISGNSVHVNKSMVRDEFGAWQLKAPKTFGSDRVVDLPDVVMDMIRGRKGRILSINPNALSCRFNKALRESGLEHFRFHDLRHYSASIMHAMGVPDQYIMARGGWASDNVMKSVYRNVIDIEQARQTLKINTYFMDKFH